MPEALSSKYLRIRGTNLSDDYKANVAGKMLLMTAHRKC